jgi:hypothetical protein
MLPGRATPRGTSEYRERFPQLRDAGHFRHPEQAPGPAELWMSSIGDRKSTRLNSSHEQ